MEIRNQPGCRARQAVAALAMIQRPIGAIDEVCPAPSDQTVAAERAQCMEQSVIGGAGGPSQGGLTKAWSTRLSRQFFGDSQQVLNERVARQRHPGSDLGVVRGRRRICWEVVVQIGEPSVSAMYQCILHGNEGVGVGDTRLKLRLGTHVDCHI